MIGSSGAEAGSLEFLATDHHQKGRAHGRSRLLCVDRLRILGCEARDAVDNRILHANGVGDERVGGRVKPVRLVSAGTTLLNKHAPPAAQSAYLRGFLEMGQTRISKSRGLKPVPVSAAVLLAAVEPVVIKREKLSPPRRTSVAICSNSVATPNYLALSLSLSRARRKRTEQHGKEIKENNSTIGTMIYELLVVPNTHRPTYRSYLYLVWWFGA
jgi:hypothetical protein